MGLNRQHQIWVGVLGFLLVILSLTVAWQADQEDLQDQRAKATEVGNVFALQINHDLYNGLERVQSLDKMVVDNNGKVKNFSDSAKLLKRGYINTIDLLPKGYIKYSYPHAYGQVGVNLEDSQELGEILLTVKKSKKLTTFGPIVNRQEKRLLIIIDPVYLKKGKFWGYVIMTLSVPKVYQNTINSLEKVDYDYQLFAERSATNSQLDIIESSINPSKKLKHPVSQTFVIGNRKWRLSLAPKNGWQSKAAMPAFIMSVLVSSVIMIWLVNYLKTKERDEELHKLAYRDPLTGLSNRRGFIRELDRQLPQAQFLTEVFLDLDDFKLINDLYGHAAGDEALQHLASYLKKSFPANSLIGRTGGDEFSVAIPDMHPLECQELIQKAIRQKQTFSSNGTEITFTISAGFADYPKQARGIQDLMTKADEALYAAKMAGKNQTFRYQPFMADLNREQLGFNVKQLAQGLPGEFLIYKADGDQKIIFANEHLIQLLGCQDYDDFMAFTKGSFQNFVHPDDRLLVEREIKRQLALQKGHRSSYDVHVAYRVKTKQGEIKHLVDLGRMIDNSNYGKVFFVFLEDQDQLAEDQL
ncbi:diguanylate cyclase domain-containing protein [Lactobacillus sp.]|uniref:sensor domain-containing diguanylate cyclase n=1 Tax=Lactobacillus sp. TaxID=1591 RepID=UPI003EF0BD7B